MRSFVASLVLAVVLIVMFTAPAFAAGERYIVVLKDGVNAGKVVRNHRVVTTHRYSHALRGFSAVLSHNQRVRLSQDNRVHYIAVDRPVSIAAKPDSPGKGNGKGGGGGDDSDTGGTTPDPQITPLGMLRVGLPAVFANGVDDQLNVDVAVIDTGIAAHSDLRIAGGMNCARGKGYSDGHGHGTHVAGTIGAIDNDHGVVGAAPGARLWAVRVLGNNGSGSISGVICGIDWVTANKDTIDVANMSLGGAGSDDGACGSKNNDPMHDAICKSVAAGVTYVVAAGNSGADAKHYTPAAYDEVITVSAIADADGSANGLGGTTCRGSADDTFASFSNWGADVDIAAPGECILSTAKDGSLVELSGTSMAAPHVAGAAAAYLAANPGASPAAVRTAIVSSADTTPIPGDPDGIWEGLLNLTGLL